MEKSSSKENFIKTFLRESGLSEGQYRLSTLAGDGSMRLFQRLEPRHGQTYIFMQNPPQNNFLKKENLAYLKIGNHLYSRGVPLPRILKYDSKSGFFILEDMGDRTLQDEASSSRERIKIYENVIETLLMLQIEGKKGFDTAWCCQTPFYDASLMREKEAWYFRDSFLRDYIGVDTNSSVLNEAFEHIISMAEKADKNYLLHRDFQSRNIMYRGEGIAILDWQGARLGPLAYDLASLLIDPYVDLHPDERHHLIDVYASLLKDIKPDAHESFKKYFVFIAVMRNLQILGAYSFLSLKQGKNYFKKYIPVALNSLRALLNEISHKNILSLLKILNDLQE